MSHKSTKNDKREVVKMCSTLMLVQGRMEDLIHVFDTFLKSATTLSMTIKNMTVSKATLLSASHLLCGLLSILM